MLQELNLNVAIGNFKIVNQLHIFRKSRLQRGILYPLCYSTAPFSWQAMHSYTKTSVSNITVPYAHLQSEQNKKKSLFRPWLSSYHFPHLAYWVHSHWIIMFFTLVKTWFLPASFSEFVSEGLNLQNVLFFMFLALNC